MASKTESFLDTGSSPKLPIISEGRSLVSPGQSTKSRSTPLQDQVSSWAADIRERINLALASQGAVDDNDVIQLKQELIALMINALQKDNRHAWCLLRESLLQVAPFSNLLQGTQEISHYLERLLHHADLHKERLFDLHIVDALTKVFTQDVESIQRLKVLPKKNYVSQPPAATRALAPPVVRSPRKQKTGNFKLPDGSLPYNLTSSDDLKEDTSWLRPKGVTLSDLRGSLADVAWETATREAIWTACLGSTAVALNTDLFDEPEPETPRQTPRTPRQTAEVQDIMKKLDQMSQASNEVGPTPGVIMNGRQAVEYFAKCYHTGKIKFLYFNLARNRHYSPYDLVAVPKNKIQKEHCVFSTFGVLHVYADQPAENLSLAEWQRQAVLFKAISHIPFFHNYLISKMFNRWRANRHFADYARVRHTMSDKLLQVIPALGAALQQIYKLCHELLHLRLLPLDDEKCYQLLEFENGINYMNRQAEKVLERFFRYNKVIVDTTAEELYKKVRHCEDQVKQKTVFSKDSLHMQRKKREEREHNLAVAKDEMSRLGAFVRLVDQMLLSHLVALSRTSITSFVNKTMQASPQAQREGLFHTILVFTPKDVLSLSPPKEKFVQTLGRTLSYIPLLCCRAAESLGGQTTVPEMRDEDEELLTSPQPPDLSSRNLSLSSQRRNSRRISQVLENLRDRRAHISTNAGRSSRLSGIEKLASQFDKPISETSLAAKEMIPTPELNREATPVKRDDDLGQMTPSMVLPSNDDLFVAGHSVMGQYKPLSSSNLEDKILKDEACQQALQRHGTLMKEAIEEIDEFCLSASWLQAIQGFCKAWNDKSVFEWRGAAAFKIEQKLNEIRQWIEKIRNFDRTYITDNRLFYVDCSGIHDSLIPKLNQIFRDLCTFVADESVSLAKAFSEEMETVTKALKAKETTIGGFALFAKNVSRCKENTGQYQQRVEYIKSLFEVIRMSFRQLTSEEERLEERVWTLWEGFLFHWQDAMEFVNIQTPLITQNLEDTYQNDYWRLEEEVHALCKEATTGKVLDPTMNPTQMIKHLAMVRSKFFETYSQMQQASKWKEAITGEPYDLEFVKTMSVDMTLRNELWKYVETATHTIRDWKMQLFRKLNVKKSMDKVTEWVAVAGQLKGHLPLGDAVLTFLYRHLQEFRTQLPLLHRLSSVALKERHWKVIFTNMGEQYDPNHQFVVEELLAYNLSTHGAMIRSVHQAALSEFAVEQQLIKLQRMWQEKSFKVAKHIPDSVYREDTTRGFDKKKRNTRDNKTSGLPRGVGVEKEDLYVLIEVEELKYLLEDSQVALQMMLSSPYLVEHKVEAEQWAESLQEAEEVIDLWQQVQTKWLYLLKIFDEPDLYRRLEGQADSFQEVHERFTEYMQLVVVDPKFTSIMSKARGEKGYRVLQGERLRKMLSELIITEEEILKHLDSVIDDARNQFTRLYFLSNSEMAELLAISRNPRALMPFVHKCFTGIKSLTFALPNQEQALNTALDYELNAHKLEVTMLHGDLGETLPLFDRLEALPSAARWMATLETYMKTTVNTVLEACVQARLEEALGQPNQILEELENIESTAPQTGRAAEEAAAQIRRSFNHWLLRFPSQCVLNAEAILWERQVFWALEKQDAEELRRLRVSLTSRLEQYVKVLQENSYNNPTSEVRQRVHVLLTCLVSQGLHHRDVIDNLLQNDNLSDGGYDWIKVLKYHMEINTVLRAKSEVDIADDEHERSKPPTAARAGRRASEFITRDDLALGRNMSMVQQGYQFGKCVVSQMGSTFAYDCEYLGPTPRLAFTPLTERAYLCLTTALNAFQCGALTGPPSTGKSETIADLAKALGRHLVVLNVSESLTMPTMNRLLSGAVQSGCWTLFDHTDRMTQGLMSVFAQQLEYVCNALRVLNASSDNQYGIRGQPPVDKKRGNKEDGKRIRRNSLTTLHSLPAGDICVGSLERQSTVPHGFNEDGLITYFEDTWVAEKERRNSVAKEISVRDSEMYKNNRPPPLFYEYVTAHRKKKTNFSDLVPNYAPYKPEYLGNILLNGHLVRASANYGCFFTINSANKNAWRVPENLKLLMRPCAMVQPDVKVVIEVFLYSNGFPNYKTLTDKLALLFKLISSQLPRRPQYKCSLKCVTTVLKIAFINYQELNQWEARRKKRTKVEKPATPTQDLSLDEVAVIRAIKMVLTAKTESQEDELAMKNIIRDVFPQASRPKSGLPGPKKELLKAVEEQLAQDRLQPNKHMVDTIMQLHTALQSRQPVMLVGPAGAGKTTTYRMLAKTLTTLHYGTPSEAKDEELAPERSLSLQYGQKLKDECEAAEDVEETEEVEEGEILQDLPVREEAKKQPQKWQKMTKMSSLLRNTLSTFKSLTTDEEDEETFPKVDVENVYPSAFAPEEYPLVDVKVIFPNTHTYPELFGQFIEGKWQSGLMSQILSNAHVQSEAARWMMDTHTDRKKTGNDRPSMIQKWIILDGVVNPAWVDTMATLVGESKKLTLANSESINLQEATSLIFEVGDIANASPSVIGQCAVLCCNPEMVSWKGLFEAWGQTAKQRWVLNTAGWQVLNSLVSSVFNNTLSFLQKECQSSLSYTAGQSSSAAGTVPGLQEVMSFIRLIAAVLDRHLKRDEIEKQLLGSESTPQANLDRSVNVRTPRGTAMESTTPSGRKTSMSRVEDFIPNYLSMLKSMFAFAFIWGFGGGLHDSCMEKFSQFARETLSKAAHPVIVPDMGTVYDYYVDFKTGQFTRWADRTLERARGVATHYTVLPELDRYNFLIDLLLGAQQSVLVTGAPGVGKTKLIEYMVQVKHPYTRMPISPGLGVRSVYSTIMSRVHEPRQQKMPGFSGVLGQGQKGRHLFFLDDLNTAPIDEAGSQPILELLRQLANQKGTYDRSRHVFVSLPDIDLLCAASTPGSPGSGYGYVSHAMSPRLTRLFTILNMFTPSESTLYAMHNKTIQTWLEEFPSNCLDHQPELAKACVRGLLDVFRAVKERLRPSPARAHYVFTLHDLAHVVEGMLLLSPRSKAKPKPKPKARREKDKELEQAMREKRAALASLGLHTPITELLRARSESWVGVSSVDLTPLSPTQATIRSITRLWCHECTRTFGDRIFDGEDQLWFEHLLDDVVTRRFCTATEESRDKMTTIPEDTVQLSALKVPTMSDPLSSRETTGMTSEELRELKMDVALPVSATPETTPLGDSTESAPMAPSSIEPPSAQLEPAEPPTTVDGPVSSEAEKAGISIALTEESSNSSDRVVTDKLEDSATPGETTDGVTTDAETGATSDDDEDDSESETEESTEEESTEEEEDSEEDNTSQTTAPNTPILNKTKDATKKTSATRKTSTGTGKLAHQTSVTSSKSVSPAIPSTRTPTGTPRSQKGSKRGVTFKTGLVDKEILRYAGPLLTKDQVKTQSELYTSFIFTRFIQVTHAQVYGIPAERGYSEASYQHLSTALNTCLGLYNSETNQKLDLVFFEDAVRHITRLVRTLITYGGHALLLGLTYCTGRATLVRLATHITGAKLFEPVIHESAEENRHSLQETMKSCSRLAAIKNRPMVLLVKESMGPRCLQDVCAFINEGMCPGIKEDQGQCPGLYTESEVQNIATLMTPGQIKVTRVDKVEAAFNKFLLRVRQNLHVIVCMSALDEDGVSLHARLAQYPVLLRQCCTLDIYRPWQFEAHVMVAQQWLQDAHRPSHIPVPWNEHNKTEQVALISKAMAYIHNASKRVVEKLHSHQQRTLKIFSPLTFKEFVYVFKVIAANIVKQERAKMDRYEAGLIKINEAFDSVASYRREVSNLAPKHQAAQAVVKEHVQFVEVHRGEYISALERCKTQEDILESLAAPLEELKEEAHSEFESVKPTYLAAVEALNSIDAADVVEIKSYPSPPPMVMYVMSAVCVLFKVDTTWADAKMLLTRENFFKDLECYDKENVPEEVFNQLRTYIHNPAFVKETVKKVSNAAACMCHWVRAVYKYAEISRCMKPKVKRLEEAQEQLNQAQALLGQKRVQANRIKSALEQRIQAHKESVAESKLINKQIQTIERRISKANNLMEHMATQNTLWRQKLKTSRSHIRTAPADALLAAAAVCYHGPLDNHSRADLMNDWLSRCEVGMFDDQVNWSEQIKPLSISARIDTMIRHMSTESLHSVQHGTPRDGPDTTQTKPPNDKVEQERSNMSTPQLAQYRHDPSIYDTGVNFHTEVRVSSRSASVQQEAPPKLPQPPAEGTTETVGNLIAVRENYRLQDILSTFDEQCDWTLRGVPGDVLSRHNALIARVSVHNRPASWPLLVDPDHQAELWVRILQEGVNVINEHELTNELPVDPEVDIQEYDVFAAEDGFSFGRTGTMNTETDVMTEGSTTPNTEVVTPRSGHGAGRRMSDLNQSTSDLLQTLLAGSKEGATFSIRVADSIDRPEHNLWIKCADDADLSSTIGNAIVHGVTVLVTHLERCPLPRAFDRLLARDYDTVEEGQVVVTVGNQALLVNPNFALFLSTSVPLFLQGDGLHPVVHHNLAVIDMAYSQEGIIDTLLRGIMSVERPEFESQRCSIERDLVHHQQDQRREQEVILERTLMLGGPILEEPGLLDALVACQNMVNRNDMILEETRYLQDHQEEKRVHYLPVAMHGAKLYEIIQRLSVLNPLYHVPLSTFLQLFANTIRSRHRGKGTQGAVKARAQELISSTTEAVYKFMSSMMFGSHLCLFELLTTLERLRMDGKLSDHELGLFVNGVNTALIEDSFMFDDKPAWLTNKVWLDCAALETTLSAFQGLRDTFKDNSDQWQEYFKCDIDLLEPVPSHSLQDLSLFQRCLLWRICAPHRTMELTRALVLYELGGILHKCDKSLQSVYPYTDKSTPVIFILPADPQEEGVDPSISGFVSAYPVADLVQLAREVGHEGKVSVVTCGVTSMMSEVQTALQEAMTAGNWLVIQNAHQSHPWTKPMLDLVKTIVYSCADDSDEDSPIQAATSKDSVETFASLATRGSHEGIDAVAVHRDFRLFITTQAGGKQLIPGYLVQYGVKVTCEQTYQFKDTVLRSYHHLEKLFSKKDRAALALRKLYTHTDPIFPMAIFHAVLLSRRLYGSSAYTNESYWTQTDLTAALEHMQVLLALCQRHRGVPDVVAQIYAGHCHDLLDAALVKSLATELLLSPKQLKELPPNPPGVSGLLASLLPSGGELLEQKLEKLVDVGAEQLSLSEAAETENTTQLSQSMLTDLLKVCGAPDLLCMPLELTHRKAELILQDVTTVLEDIPHLPEPKNDAYYPMEVFFQSEVRLLRQLIETVQSGATLLLKIARGQTPGTPESQKLLVEVSKQGIPKTWFAQSFPSSQPLTRWARSLTKRVEGLKEYQEVTEDKVTVYNLAVFSRPDRFMQSLLQTYARKEFRDINSLLLQTEVLSPEIPTSPPPVGVYVGNLSLHNAVWDAGRASLVPPASGQQLPAAIPLVWFKPVTMVAAEKEAASAKYNVYKCPVYLSGTSAYLDSSNAITMVDFPTEQKPGVWTNTRVRLSCNPP